MKIQGMNRRWFFSSFCAFAGLIIVLFTGIFLFIVDYHYDYAYTVMNERANDLVSSYFSPYLDGTDESFIAGAVSFIEDFSDKSMMEVWVLDKNGQPVVSSSGFLIDPKTEMPDYTQAMNSTTEKGKWTGRNRNGEKVMAITMLLPNRSGAVRYISSMQNINRQLFGFAGIILLFVAVILFAVWALNYRFIRMAVSSVRRINTTATLLGKGDWSARVDLKGMHDEISELGQSFNNMAAELGQAESLKNDFISTISHELRTPLTAIKGWGETIIQLADTDPETTSKGMSVIVGESQRLSDMVEELLDFSRMQNGQMQVNMTKMDVLAELDDAVFTLKDRILREGLELIYNVPHYPIPMQGDPARIRQVFVNLIDNAVKYNEHGGKVIILAEMREEKLVIFFTDTGCGIASENISKVKNKFFRANSSVHGTGIGLAVADEVIQIHGGTLEINSVVGDGTTVTVTLPVDPVELPESPLPERTETDE
ncbi:MAG TPA: sensor histidine kinase [Ruminococcaceae bacterium]|nr:sensor histidine kinase [Oscillospiraceae bacterium]